MYLIKKLNDNYFIYAAFIFTYLPLFFLPQLFDGVSFLYIFENGSFDSLKLWFSEASRHIHLLVLSALFFLATYTPISSEFLFDIFALIILVLICFEVKVYSKFLFKLENKWCNLAAFFTAIFPVWHTLSAINISLYLFSIYFLFFGYRNFISNNKIKIFIGLISLIISFNVESNLCFVIGLGSIHFLLSRAKKIDYFSYLKLLRVIIISFLYYFAKDIYFPPFGLWSEYNKINLPLIMENLINGDLFINIFNFTTYLLYYLWIPLFYLINLAIVNKKFFSKIELNIDYTNKYFLLILLSAFATFPYLVVDALIPSLFYLADYYQRHAFLLAPIFGIFFSIMFRDFSKIDIFKHKIKINFYLIIFICFNLILLNYGNYRKIESHLFRKNLINELKFYGEIPKGNVELISKNIPADLRVFEINYLLYETYGIAGWWGRESGPSQNLLKDKRYSFTYIFNDYKYECNIYINLKNDLEKFERMKKFYIFDYKNYYKIDKIVKKC